MKFIFHNYLIIFSLCLFAACGSDSADTASKPVVDTEVDAKSDSATAMPIPSEVQKPGCEKEGTMLDGNEFWANEVNKLIRIVATDATKDANLGESHRVLQVYDGVNCQLMQTETLPVDGSPDFAFRIADITYNNESKIIAIQGFKKIYCYNIQTGKLYRAVEPKFLNKRFAEDAQSGRIKRLEVWEDYLIGYAQDLGSFVFNLKNGQPEVVEPFAEFEIVEGESYNSMFLLKSKADTYQAILPKYDANTNEFQMNPVLPEPLYISHEINPRYRNNRYQLLKEVISENAQNIVAVDMKTNQKVELPANVAKLQNTKILEWLKANQK